MHPAPGFPSPSLQLQTAVTPVLLSQKSPPCQRSLAGYPNEALPHAELRQSQKISLTSLSLRIHRAALLTFG